MPRFKIKDGSPIKIAYGYDEDVSINGVFLSVFDSRLKWRKDASDQANEITKKICIPDGGGCYLGLYTGNHGLGWKVDEKTMRVYMLRYGVDPKQIDACFDALNEHQLSMRINWQLSMNVNWFGVPQQKLSSIQMPPVQVNQHPDTEQQSGPSCLVCHGNTTKSCAKCKSAFYCTKECQTADWPTHKFFCHLLPFPVIEKTPSNENEWVYGLLLDENKLKPDLIQIELEIKSSYEDDDECPFKYPSLDMYLGKDKIRGRSFMPRNPLKPARKMSGTLEFIFRDDFLKDGSQSNKCVQSLTKNKQGHDWRGPIVVMKISGLNEQYLYLNIELNDFQDVIDFFLYYGNYY